RLPRARKDRGVRTEEPPSGQGSCTAGGSSGRALEEESYEREQLGELEGLDEIGIGAGLGGGGDIRLSCACARNQDRRLRDSFRGADAAGDLEPAEAGHVDVEYHQARCEPAGQAQRLPSL